MPRPTTGSAGQVGSFGRSMQALEHLRAAGVATQINCTIARHNQHQLGEVLELGKQAGAVGRPLLPPRPGRLRRADRRGPDAQYGRGREPSSRDLPVGARDVAPDQGHVRPALLQGSFGNRTKPHGRRPDPSTLSRSRRQAPSLPVLRAIPVATLTASSTASPRVVWRARPSASFRTRGRSFPAATCLSPVGMSAARISATSGAKVPYSPISAIRAS